jgi:hypothetical protein
MILQPVQRYYHRIYSPRPIHELDSPSKFQQWGYVCVQVCIGIAFLIILLAERARTCVLKVTQWRHRTRSMPIKKAHTT